MSENCLTGGTLPSISVIIPACNSGRTIEKSISSCLAQNYPEDRLEIIVVNNGSKDETTQVVNQLMLKKQNFRHLMFDKPLGLYPSICEGAKISKRELLFILASDVELLGKNCFLELVSILSSSNRVGLVTPQLLLDIGNLNRTNRIFSFIYIPGWMMLDGKELHPLMSPEYYVRYAPLINDLIPRSIFDEFSLGVLDVSATYPKQVLANADLVFCDKLRNAGYKIIMSTRAKTNHILSSFQSTLSGNLSKAWKYGYPSARILKHRHLAFADNLFFAVSSLITAITNIHAIFDKSMMLALWFIPLLPFLLLAIFGQMPPFLENMKASRRTRSKPLAYFLSAILSLLLFQVLLKSSLVDFLKIFPVFLGASVPVGRGLMRGSRYYHVLGDSLGSLGVLFLSVVWDMINGVSVLVGICAGAFWLARTKLLQVKDILRL